MSSQLIDPSNFEVCWLVLVYIPGLVDFLISIIRNDIKKLPKESEDIFLKKNRWEPLFFFLYIVESPF